MDYKKELIDIIEKVLPNIDLNRIVKNDEFAELEMNSVSFISLVGEIEKKFGIEFDDENLVYNNYKTFTSLCDYVESKVALIK